MSGSIAVPPHAGGLGAVRLPAPIRRFLKRPGAVAALVFILLLMAVCGLAEYIAPHDPLRVKLSAVLQGASGEYLLGTDDLGRDTLSRMMFAGQNSLAAAALAVTVAMAIGVPLGLISGFFGGVWDILIMRLTDALMSIPFMVLAIAIVGMLGAGLLNAMVAIGIAYSPFFIRLVRGQAMAIRDMTFIEASVISGCSTARTLYWHVLPNIVSPIIVQATLSMSLAMIAEASLSFLGLGVQAPDASWGSMLRRGFDALGHAPVIVLVPGVAIMAAVLAFNALGEGIRDSIGREIRSGR